MTAAIIRRRPRPVFHPLTVAGVDELTEDAVVVTFAVPRVLREAYDFSPGQHLTVRRVDPSEPREIRRSYSICSHPRELAEHGRLRIGVRVISGGTFSRYAARGLRTGDVVEVLPPLGHFTTALEPSRTRHYAAIVAGSGITPVLSLVMAALSIEPASRFTVLYGNRRSATVMFADELADLKDRYPDRLHIVHVLSREPSLSQLLSGRIDAKRLRAILDSGLVDPADEWFLCGPYGMVIDAQGVLAERGVPDSCVHTELFHVPTTHDAPAGDEGPTGGQAPVVDGAAGMPSADGQGTGFDTTVTIRLDGRESTTTMGRHERVLDAALRVRSELPYACRGGVCSTCRAKVVRGEVAMANNYALEPDEIAAGYVLTCQSSPLTGDLVVDYDA